MVNLPLLFLNSNCSRPSYLGTNFLNYVIKFRIRTKHFSFKYQSRVNCSQSQDSRYCFRLTKHCTSIPIPLFNGNWYCAWNVGQKDFSPIHNCGKKTDSCNYRWICFLPTSLELLELLVQKQLKDYLTMENLLTIRQSQFRINQFTSTTVVDVSEFIIDMIIYSIYVELYFLT